MYLVIFILLVFLFWASYDITSGIYLKSFCRNERAKGVVAVTFDDGVDPLQTPKVLDVLKRANVQATFFVIASKAEKYPELVRRMVAEGHLVGSHTYGHQATFPILGKKSMVAELRQAQEVLERITGEKINLFRPPFGVTNPTVAYAVKKMNYQSVGWSIRSFDTNARKSRERVVQRIMKKMRGEGDVILLHDDRAESDHLLEVLLKAVKERGYQIERLDQLMKRR